MYVSHEFRRNGNVYTLYYDGKPMDVRVYPVQRGDEPVMLSPEGRIVSSVVWYGEGGPEDSPVKRAYISEEAALEKELEMAGRWIIDSEVESNGESDYVSETFHSGHKPIGKDRFAAVLISGSAEIDTGFIFDKSDDGWNILYDGAVWAAAKDWDAANAAMNHIKSYIIDILSKGPNALKEFTARYAWKDKGASKALLDNGTETSAFIQPASGGFFCYYNGDCSEEIFPTMEEAQAEAQLRYTGDKFESLMEQVNDATEDDYEDED
jgi:hypothetical protein